MTSLSRLILSFLAVFGVAGPCLADFLIDAPVTPASVPSGSIPTTRAITVGKFDPALGTLKSVQITMRTVLQGAMGVENQSVLSGSTNVSLTFNAGVFLFQLEMRRDPIRRLANVIHRFQAGQKLRTRASGQDRSFGSGDQH